MRGYLIDLSSIFSRGGYLIGGGHLVGGYLPDSTVNLCFLHSVLTFFKNFCVIFSVIMPDKCCAVNCRTGYNDEPPPASLGISLFGFPWDNPDLVDEWKKRISRKDWEPTKSSKICSLHFKKIL